MVSIQNKGMRPQLLCIDPDCPSKMAPGETIEGKVEVKTVTKTEIVEGKAPKKKGAKGKASKESSKEKTEKPAFVKPAAQEVGRNCPKCEKPLLMRSSIYGKFIGCSGYPKCRYTEKMAGQQGGNDELL
jgi:DNA topoisomerase-1